MRFKKKKHPPVNTYCAAFAMCFGLKERITAIKYAIKQTGRKTAVRDDAEVSTLQGPDKKSEKHRCNLDNRIVRGSSMIKSVCSILIL